ncbi:MAG TPA: Ig-like domain-containing protein [Gemmatimonadales bacterium]|nr:Ig-like domain-containing protein [Gemmatimonadales bacterium]
MRKPDGKMSRAFKLAAGAVSTAAAAASIVSTASSLNERQAAALAGQKAAEVRFLGVSPSADTAFAVGDTLQLTATIADAHGAALTGVAPVWSSDRLDVVSVDSAGAVVAQGQGIATVTVAAGGRMARATITVRQVPAGLAIAGDTVLHVPEGERVRSTAQVLDARGHEIVGLAPAWYSGDLGIAAVDATGEITGVTPGHTVLTAQLGGLSARLAAEVIPVPASITVVSGEGQRAPVERRIAAPITVQVVSRGGRPIQGVPVRFSTTDGGSVEPAIDTSNSHGIARTAWVLGAVPGRQRLTPSVDGITAAPTVVAEADPVPANTRVTLVSEGAAGIVGSLISEPVTIRVTDSAGTALADLPVTWVVGDGGLMAEYDARTDSLGRARARWRLGSRAGLHGARALVGNPRSMPAFVVTAVAHAGAPATVRVLSGAAQAGPVGAELKKPIVARITDQAGNPVPGAALIVRPLAGSVADTIVASDSAGRVSVRWTLGRSAGAQRIMLRLDDADTTVDLAVQARSLDPANLAFEAAPPSGSTARKLAKPLAVVVTDAYGNPVADRAVRFSPRAGRVAPAKVMTDARGRAQTTWTLGSKPGEQTLEAAIGPLRDTATVVARKPAAKG